MTYVASDRAPARSLISEDLFTRLVRRITIEEGTDSAFAERIMDQALAFLGACGRFPGNRLAPSKPVDIGWHAFILHTREYAEFCEQVAGRFIHHVPQDAPGASDHSKDPASVRDGTIDAIHRAGYVVDAELWLVDAYKCGSCHEEGNCAASGTDGDENTDTRK
ncbi:glycine-rich domain-containing protein [Saccharopolyspora sp. MS10]|uniref:glycine-rich domain-containing protein n=1 Tax=Saccharopolyspora sp. MS10 TaxID=3385973 RepID=UPI0039A389CF